jgi:hypothetical protein
MRYIKEHKNSKSGNGNFELRDYMNFLANRQERNINPYSARSMYLGSSDAKILIGTGILITLMGIFVICFICKFDLSSIFSWIFLTFIGGLAYMCISSGLYRLKQEKIKKMKKNIR